MARELQSMLTDMREAKQRDFFKVAQTPFKTPFKTPYHGTVEKNVGDETQIRKIVMGNHAKDVAVIESNTALLVQVTSELDQLLVEAAPGATPVPRSAIFSSDRAEQAASMASSELTQLVRETCGITFATAGLAVATVLKVLLTQSDTLLALSLARSLAAITVLRAHP